LLHRIKTSHSELFSRKILATSVTAGTLDRCHVSLQ